MSNAIAGGGLPRGQAGVLDEVYGTGNEVKDTVDQIHEYQSQSSGGDWDPLSTLISKGLGFVIDYIEPVKEALQLVTGDPDALNAAAQNYNKISDETNQLGQQLHDELAGGFANWQGDASDAAKKQMATFLDGIHGTAQLSASISEVLQASAVLMKAAKAIIIGILADFVEQMLITWAVGLAGSILTLGASDAAATAATVTEAGIAIGRAGEEVSKVSKLIEKIASIVKKILEVISKISKILEKIGGKISKVGGKIGNIAEKVTEKGGKLGEMLGKNIGNVGEKVGGYGKDLTKGGENLGKVAKAGEAGDKAGAEQAIRDTMDSAGKIKGDFHEIHDKADEYKSKAEDLLGGGSDDSGDAGGHMKIPGGEHKGFGDIAKEHLSDGGKDVWANEKDIGKEAFQSGAYPHQSNRDISSELNVSGGERSSKPLD